MEKDFEVKKKFCKFLSFYLEFFPY